jgi:hypothetical protein
MVKKKFGAVECEASVDLSPVTIEVEGKIPQSLVPQLELDMDGGAVQWFTFRIDGPLEAAFKATMGLGAALTGEVTCAWEMSRIRIPVTGFLSAIIAPSIPFKFKSVLTASVAVNLFNFGVEIKQPAKLAAGIEYREGDGFHKIDSLQLDEPEFNPTMTFPPSTSLRVRADLFAGLATGIDLGGVLGEVKGGSGEIQRAVDTGRA